MAQRLEKQAAKRATKSLFLRTALCLMGGILFFSGSAQGGFLAGDLNGDCQVDIDDLVLMTSQWIQASCDAETGLIVHWKLNESIGSTAADSSGSGYNGTVFEASWNPAGGILDGALQFDGTNDYVWSSYQGITGSNLRTCATWIKTDQPSGEIMTWGNRDIVTGRWVVWLDETGVLRVDVGGGYIFGTTVLTDDLWHHIAVTSDGSTTDNIVLYVDGQIESTGEVVSQSINTQASATTKLGVFQLPSMEGSYFTGLIDDARIYDRVLSMKEIWTLAITGTTITSCPDLNADKIVNLNDFAQLSQNWGEETPPILINEFLADNESKSPLESGEILDGNYESSDWIELHNNSEMVIDIGGWYLTDESDLQTKWQFPLGMGQLVLQPGDFLIVFASGKTQAENSGNYPYVDPAGYLHTNFELSKNGEYLGLIDADGTTPIHEYNHFELGGGEYGYPDQEEDIPYGFYYDEPRYFSQSTPGTDNVKSAFEEFVAKPDVNIKGGCYENAFDVTLSCDTEGAFIRYTTDGTAPSLINGTDYTGPIHISSLTTIIAKAFKPGLQRSDTRIETYIFVDPAVAPFNSNLPIIVIDTLGVTIPQDKVNKPWTHSRAVIVDIDDVTGRAEITGPEHFEGLGQIRYRGESTYGTKRHFAFEIQDEYGQDKDVSLLGMPAESDWVITGEKLDYTFLKCEIAFKWFRDMGHYAPRQRYVEMYVNEDGGEISTSDYKGIFVLREKIKRNDDRVDIARLDASHNLEPKVSGGYIIKCDKYNDGDTLLADGSGGLVDPDYLETGAPYNIHVTGNGKPILAEPDYLEVTQPQLDWITDYINEFHSVLWQNAGSSYYPGPGPDYTDYIDVISWIDHGIVEQVGADSDAFWGSYYTHKDRDGKIYSGPPWDFDRGFHNNAGSSNSYTVWKSNGAIFGKWHQKLDDYLEYRMMLADRWFEHREDVLNTALTMAYIDETVALITEAMGRSIDKYGFPGSGGTYAGEIFLFKDWITNRLDWLDGEIASRFAEKPPVFSPVGGYVNQGDSLAISLPSGGSGTIYYTLNGEDPRLEGGGINPNAQIYDDPGGPTTETITIVTEDAAKAVLVPNTDIGMSWTGGAEPYDDSTWTHGTPTTGVTVGGVGYDENSTYVGYITYDVESLMNNVMGTCYIRIPFTAEADDIADATSMTLRIRYDDGFRAYLNDTEIASDNAPSSPGWDTDADGQHDDSLAVILLDFDCSAYLGSLQTGDNILAIRGFNQDTGSSDFLISAELVIEVDSTPPGSGDITFDKNTCVKARIKDGGDWSAQNKELYAVGPVLENLRITEIMYHPTDPTPAEKTATGNPDLIDEDFEFIELKNVGGVAINLNLVSFTNGVEYTFDDSVELNPGAYVVVYKNEAAFNARYPGFTGTKVGSYLGVLNNDGEEINLEDALGAEIHDFDYSDGWYEITDGLGFSLTIRDPSSSDPNDWDRKSGWRASFADGGSPGEDDSAFVLPDDAVIVNELLAHADSLPTDWVEFCNTTDDPINIGGWFISDDDNDLMKYEIEESFIIPAHGYAVFYADPNFGPGSADPGSLTGFAFSESGEKVYLTSGSGGEITGVYSTERNFDPSEADVAFGHYVKSTGGNDFVAMSSNTPGWANVYPKVGPIVINEICYNPLSQNDDEEYVELLNISGSAVTLYDPVKGAWRFVDDASDDTPTLDYLFPTGGSAVTLQPGDYFLLLRNKTAFEAVFGAVPGGVQWAEWVSGKLGNGGEQPELQMPGEPGYYIRVDRVTYDDEIPWPTEPDGSDIYTLQRKVPGDYGNDVANWQAAIPTPGS